MFELWNLIELLSPGLSDDTNSFETRRVKEACGQVQMSPSGVLRLRAGLLLDCKSLLQVPRKKLSVLYLLIFGSRSVKVYQKCTYLLQRVKES